MVTQVEAPVSQTETHPEEEIMGNANLSIEDFEIVGKRSGFKPESSWLEGILIAATDGWNMAKEISDYTSAGYGDRLKRLITAKGMTIEAGIREVIPVLLKDDGVEWELNNFKALNKIVKPRQLAMRLLVVSCNYFQ